MSKPTEPGFYWAKSKHGTQWYPVDVFWFDSFQSRELKVAFLGDGCMGGLHEVEFGPRIPQYEPDIHTRDTAVELPPITDADLEGA